MPAVLIRPLLAADVPAATAVAMEALPVPAEFDDGGRSGWIAARMEHLRATDPDGVWVAEDDGAVAGVALALVRDGIWGLSLLAVRPSHQARGAGSQLLDATLRHADQARGAIIASSTDPRAMRAYARAGFDLRPCVTLAGILDRAALPSGLRARPTEDFEQGAALAAPVRGGAYGAGDLALLCEHGSRRSLLLEGRGFAMHERGSPTLLVARDDEAATDLLWSCFAAAPRGGTVHVDFITAGQDWAIRAGLAAGLVLSPEGPLYTRGSLGPLRPWLPSGALL
jgi:GNAT superfamily N-acetyltransferase